MATSCYITGVLKLNDETSTYELKGVILTSEPAIGLTVHDAKTLYVEVMPPVEGATFERAIGSAKRQYASYRKYRPELPEAT